MDYINYFINEYDLWVSAQPKKDEDINYLTNEYDLWVHRHPKKDGKSTADLKAEYARIVSAKRAEKKAAKAEVSGQFPIWPEPLRAIPNEVVRSALFNAKNHKTPRLNLKNELMYSLGIKHG